MGTVELLPFDTNPMARIRFCEYVISWYKKNSGTNRTHGNSNAVIGRNDENN